MTSGHGLTEHSSAAKICGPAGGKIWLADLNSTAGHEQSALVQVVDNMVARLAAIVSQAGPAASVEQADIGSSGPV